MIQPILLLLLLNYARMEIISATLRCCEGERSENTMKCGTGVFQISVETFSVYTLFLKTSTNLSKRVIYLNFSRRH